jgi:hypothetical protein
MEQQTDHDIKANIPLARINSRLEDALYLQADKLLALCRIQAAWDSAEYTLSPTTRTHYSLVIEEQALELRRLLDRMFM